MDIKDQYTRVFLEAAGIEPSEDQIKHARISWWWNVRSKSKGGLRLTEAGKKFIEDSADIKTYEVKFPPDFEFTSQVILWLDNFIECPFYINKKHIVVLTEKSAFELYLFSGDVRKLGHSKALAKRLNQI